MMRSVRVVAAIVGVWLLHSTAMAAPEVERRTGDLGEIIVLNQEDWLRKVPSEFSFVNKTGETLAVGNIKRSCACTDAQVDRDTVKPGESLNVIISVDVGKKRQAKDFPVRESVLIELAGPSKQLKLILEVTGKVKLRGFLPILDLGSLKDDKYKVVRYFDLGAPASRHPALTGVRASSADVETWVKNVDGEQRVYLSFDMQTMRLGRNNFTLTGEFARGGSTRTMETLVRFDKIPKISCPGSVSLGLVESGEPSRTQTFHIGPGYEGVSVDIKAITVEPSDVLKCSWTAGNDGRYRVTVQFDASKYAGPDSFQGCLHVEFVQSHLAPLDVPVFALLQSAHKPLVQNAAE